jgi:thioredoxin 1
MSERRRGLFVRRVHAPGTRHAARLAMMIDESLAIPRRQARRDGIRTVIGATFDSLVLQAKEPVVVEFMSYGCSHCGELEPVLQQVAEMVKSQGEIFRVDIVVEEALGTRYEVRVTPTLIMFLNGREVGRVEGPLPTVPGVLTAVTRPFRVMR